MKSIGQSSGETSSAKDLLLVGVFVSVVMLAAVPFDAFGEFIRWYSANGKPRILGGITVAAFLLPVALGIFSYRRWREVRNEINARQRMEERRCRELEMRNLLLWLHEEVPPLSDRELYDSVLERTVRLTDSTIGFFHLVSDDQRDVILTTWNGEAVKNCTASCATHYRIEQAGNWVDCVRYRRPIVYNDFPNSPNQRGLPEGHAEVRRFMSVPVIEEDKVRIIFGVGNKAEPYDEHDVMQIQLVATCLQNIIKQRRSEVVLRQSRERLSMALESSQAGIWDRNIVESMSEWDDNHHRLFGLAPGTHSGKPNDFFSMIHPADRERVRMEMDAAINGNAEYSTTYRVVWPDSSVHFLADRGKVYRDVEGRAVRMLGISWDISDLKQAEEALHESQQQFKNIINFLPDATFVIDGDGKVIAWNRAIEEMTGVGREEILGKGNYEYALPFHGERRPILIDLALRSHDESEARYDIIERRDSLISGEAYMPAIRGGDAYLFGTASVLRDSLGNVVGAIESIRDITDRKRAEEELHRYRSHLEELVKERTDTLARVNEQLVCEIEIRKKAEEALRESQRMLQLVLDTIPARVFWKNLDLTYLGCNRPFSLDAGLQSPEDIIGKVDFEMGWVEQAESYRADDRLVMETGRPKLGYEEPLTTRDGRRIWLRTNKVPLLDADGNTRGVLGTYEDITENKRMEEALRESSQKLKHFAYSVAHDLKSPAIGVYGLTRRLARHARDMLDEKGRSYCDQILKTSEHIAALVDKINTYIATKEARLSIERINFSEIIQMLGDEFSSRLSIRGIDWIEPASRIEIKADRMSMVRAFRNFVDNSLKYGGDRLSKIWIGYEETQEFHIFSFGDNGEGLKEGGSEKIFEAFQRDENSKGVEGAGLGLTIVKEIAEQHGGKVWVEPKSGKGVTFCISISRHL